MNWSKLNKYNNGVWFFSTVIEALSMNFIVLFTFMYLVETLIIPLVLDFTIIQKLGVSVLIIINVIRLISLNYGITPLIRDLTYKR